MPDLFTPRYLVSTVFGILLGLAGGQTASAEMLWEVRSFADQSFQQGEVRGYGSNCREGNIVSASISVEQPIPTTSTLLRAARGFDVFENRKSSAGGWDFSVANEGPAATVKITVSIMCYTGEVVEYFYD